MELLLKPWPWYISGTLIAGTMILLLFFGKTFGVSSNFRHICAMCGAGNFADFFRYDWKAQKWNLLFILGSVVGGFIAHFFLSNGTPVQISSSTISDLKTLGFEAPNGLQPEELFGNSAIFSLKNIVLLSIGGFLIGFGTRYANGCTSGHAISGLSNLQLPSLIAVIGFFVGGLAMTHFIFPLLF